jgi:hypothetical protein
MVDTVEIVEQIKNLEITLGLHIPKNATELLIEKSDLLALQKKIL